MTANLLSRPLVSAAELAAAIHDRRVRPVDVRWKLGIADHGRRVYEGGHLPGAIFLDLDGELSDPDGLGAPGRHPLPYPADFARLLGDVGIGDDTFVVAYDDAGGTVAARLWWMLDDLGHDAVAVLDGGIDAWRDAGLPLTTEPPVAAPTAIHLRGRWSRVLERAEVGSRAGGTVLLDARAPERYRGEVEPVDPVAGHIPGAISAPTTDNLADGRMLGAEALAARFQGLGVGPTGPAIVYCGSGVNAAHQALAMRIAGLPDPLLYAGSYSDWTRSGLAVATGREPGELR